MSLFSIDDKDMKIHLEGVIANTDNGEIIITLPKGSGKYSIDVIPMETEK